MTNDESMCKWPKNSDRAFQILSAFGIRASSFASGVFQYLLDRSVAGENVTQSILAQRYHSKLDRFLLQNDGRRALVDQFAKWVGDFHQLVNSFAAFVAGVVASVASFAVKKFAVANVASGNSKLREK